MSILRLFKGVKQSRDQSREVIIKAKWKESEDVGCESRQGDERRGDARQVQVWREHSADNVMIFLCWKRVRWNMSYI